MYWSWDSEVVIRVGEGEERREFRGPRYQLAQQSGYIKSLLETSQSNEILVPNISPDVFGPILRYVTTGYLELTPDNVYTVLLASHVLHMPRAVEICRDYLMRREEETRRLPLLVRPIPSRKYHLPFWPPPPPPLFSSPQFYPPPPPIPPAAPIQVFSSSPPEPAPSTSIVPQAESPRPEVQSPSSPSTTTTTPPPLSADKKQKQVVKDIACCDGPVRFKRVLNSNYGCTGDSERNDRRAAEAKQLYVCTFCKHTFKSHYCYRKHTRRHINPVSVKPVQAETKDMNVQYYPCKTCGSKFPSYYFVHKHRKMCHVNETDIEEVPQKTPEPVEETNGS